MYLDPGVLRSGDGPTLVLWSASQDPGEESQPGQAAEEGDQAHTDCDHSVHHLLAPSLHCPDDAHLHTTR